MAGYPTGASHRGKAVHGPEPDTKAAPTSPIDSALPREADEIYRVPVDGALEQHLRAIHEAVSNRPQTPDAAPARPSAVAAVQEPAAILEPGLKICSQCLDQMKPAGLPYRIVLRCSHEETV